MSRQIDAQNGPQPEQATAVISVHRARVSFRAADLVITQQDQIGIAKQRPY